MRASAVVLFFAAAAFAQAPRPSCVSDGDCVITTFEGCCGRCCPPSPYAMSRAQLRSSQSRCAVIDCKAPNCGREECGAARPESDFEAACRGGSCVAVERGGLGSPDECRGDDDCVLSGPPCCGGCCGEDPDAMTKAQLRRRQNDCARMKCARPDCSRVRCEPTLPIDGYAVRCRARRCVRVLADEPRPPPAAPAAQCHADAECSVVYSEAALNAACRSSPCGCCPGTEPIAAPVEGPGRIPLTRSASTRPTKPPFGLTPGNTGARCGECPPQRPANAVCRQGQCVLKR